MTKISLGVLLLTTCLAFPALAQETRKPLEGRAELNVRGGSERSILMNEFWVPLTQTDNSVLFGDLRLMGDDQDNREFNAGIGYRKIINDVPVLGNGVAGGHLWFDRRITDRGSRFNQITAGAEWSGKVVDIKLNGYIPLSSEKSYVAPGAIAASDPFLAGTGIFYRTAGGTIITEEPQPGFDVELGFNINSIVDNFTDSTRVYAGGYHFIGDKSDNVTGWRTRIASDITEDFQIGARFQRDDERGSQSFLEATIRFPFGNKKSYREHGLYARLDESPERDIDIVTGAAKTVTTSVTAPVLNAQSGQAQRVIYVDNSAPGGGNGSKDSPYNSLAAAEGSLADYDVVYVSSGNGTSTNMNNGITIARPGVSLIGSGSAFVFDGAKFSAGGTNFTGTVLIPQGTAPIITNGAGDGISITADNVSVSGFTINNTNRDGIRATFGGGQTFANVSISNITTNNTAQRGVYILANPTGTIGNVSINDIRANNSGYEGVRVQAEGGTITNTTVSNINSIGSGVNSSGFGRGLLLYSNSNGMINNAEIHHVSTSNSVAQGIYVIAQAGADMGTVYLHDVTSNNNNAQNVWVHTNNVGSTITSFIGENITANNSATTSGSGITIESASGQIGNAALRGITANNNRTHGIYIVGAGTSSLTASVERAVTTGNTQHGIAVYDDTSGTFEVDLGGGGRSAGRNVLAANTLEDLALDYDGRAITAMNNWWGQASGPDQDAPNVGVRPQIYYGAPINNGLVGHWTFDNEWMSGTTAYDRSGNNNNGTLQSGLSLVNLVTGQKRQALNFDGVDDYVSIANPSLGNAFTVASSFNATSLATQRPIFGGYNAAIDTQNYLALYNAGGWRFAMDQFTPSNNQALSTGIISTGTWYSGAGVQTSATTRYVSLDGTAGAVATEAYTGGPSTIYAIGGRIDTTGYRFHGAIDDVRLYNRVLSAAEISELNRMDTSSVVNFTGFLTSAP